MALAGPSIVRSPTRPIRLYGVKAGVGGGLGWRWASFSRRCGPLPLGFDAYFATPTSNRMAVTGKRPHARRKPCEALVAGIPGSVHCDEEAPRPIATVREVDYRRRSVGLLTTRPTKTPLNEWTHADH